MKKFFFLFASICLIFFYQAENIFAQEEPGSYATTVQYKGCNSQNPDDLSGIPEQRAITQEETRLMNEIQELRERNDRSLINRILELENQLEGLNPNSVSKPGEYYDGVLLPAQGDISNFSPELIGNAQIYNSGTTFVSSIATATEQIGATAGRIWVAFSLRGSGADSLRFFFSDNNGISWTLYAFGMLGGADRINYDQMDMEIIENSSGEKYVWVVYGYRNDAGAGRWRTGGVILQTPTFAAGFYALSWPGDDASKRYYRLRVTSDNASYPSGAFLYMVASFDSVSGSIHVNTQKTLRCTNPYTVSPTFQYKGDRFYWYADVNYIVDLHSDIAYFKNIYDSLIVSYSNVPDSTRLWFAKSNVYNGPGTSSGAGTAIGGNQPDDHKQYARLSSNGNNNGSIFCVFRQRTNSRWWIKYFRTTNHGNFNSIAGQSALQGSVTSNAYQPEIVGVRNKPKHYFAWRKYYSGLDSLRYVGVTAAGSWLQDINMMNVSNQTWLSGWQGPKPGFRHADNDSCFAIYVLDGPRDVWAAFGCSPGSSVFQLTVNVANGWNMVSIPGLLPVDQNVNSWWAYRDMTANVFRYSSGYIPVTTAVPGTGYWMKHAGARTYNTGGEWPANGINIVPHNPISAAAGWNLFGGYELVVTAANVTTNPPGLQSGPIYKYSGGYSVASTLDPGYGYWIKLNAAGQIIIPETMAKGEVVEYFPEDWGRIVLTDATGINYTLYAVKGEVNLDNYELPPAPPAGTFDIRFSSGRIAEDINSAIKTIDMSGVTYPLTVRVEGMDIRLMDETGKSINVNLKAGEDVVISDATVMKLMVSGELIPAKYSLEQNYPNPFNPSTIIEFSLPEDVTNVKLSIYNALGEKVAELVNTSLTAGKYQYQWNASNVATGVYIYELRTDKFVSVKKMLLMK